MNKMKDIISLQLLLKFEQDDDKVGLLKGDHKATHQCLINTLSMITLPNHPRSGKGKKTTNNELDQLTIGLFYDSELLGQKAS